jgi:hypothetical protein
LKRNTCKYCKHHDSAVWPPRRVLICKTSPAFKRKWHVVDHLATCPKFQHAIPKELASIDSQDDNIRIIPLTRGKFAIVDAEDYPELSKHKWHATRDGRNSYATRRNNGKTTRMHRHIMNAPDHLVVDHIDRNGLNNTKANLRLCTHRQNHYNSKNDPKNKSSKYKGVAYKKNYNRYTAQIKQYGKTQHLGTFKTEREAAKAYDKKAKILFKEFAYLNFPEEK